jgi:hypothetical protein
MTPKPAAHNHNSDCYTGNPGPCKAQRNAAHTPTPWKVDICSPKHDQKGITIQTQGGIVIAHIQWQLDDSEKANAAYIVRAVNCHEEFLELMKYIIAHEGNINYQTMFEYLKKAIAKAEKI